jgi:hypothetical protein
MLKTSFFKILTRDNTAPFILVSLLYCALLSTPFLYFVLLKSRVHESKSVSIDAGLSDNVKPDKEGKLNSDTLDIKGGNNIPLNKFDKVDEYSTPNDESEASSELSPFVTTNNVTDWKKDADSRGFIMLTKIAIFSIVVTFGALGAAISLITRIRSNEYTINNITAYEILSVQTIGAVFALILGFVFMGNMIAGTLFPNPIVFTRIIYVPPAFGKLIVWSFIAGFSERFVPNILSGFSKKAEQENTVKG